jgi:ethanolamine utilization protein EutQ
MSKSPPRGIPFDGVAFTPRFEHGENCSVGVVCGTEMGGELGTGFARFDKARIPWTTRYDEVVLVLDGVLTVHIDGAAHRLGKHDCLWIPEGTALVYESGDALVYYAIHPVNWS